MKVFNLYIVQNKNFYMLTEFELNLIKNEYEIIGCKAVSEKLKKPISTISNVAHRLKLKVSNKSKKEIYSKSNKSNNKSYIKSYDKYNINPDVFFCVNSAETAYTLGFMWGDGYLYENEEKSVKRIEVCNNISVDIDSIKHIFYKLGNWCEYKRTRKNREEQCSLLTNNKVIFNYLSEMGFKNKSHISPDKIIETIPDEFKMYFYLGLSDADGCFYLNRKTYNYQYSITSSYDQDWTFFSDLCDKLNIKHKIVIFEKNLKGYSQIRITNKPGIIKIGDYLYKNIDINNIGLIRKYNKYLEIKNNDNIIL